MADDIFLIIGGGVGFLDVLGGGFSTGPANSRVISSPLLPDVLSPLVLHICFSVATVSFLRLSSVRSPLDIFLSVGGPPPVSGDDVDGGGGGRVLDFDFEDLPSHRASSSSGFKSYLLEICCIYSCMILSIAFDAELAKDILDFISLDQCLNLIFIWNIIIFTIPVP